jgi:alkanesulfonate monooxygenase SsuD/methylene tetrahydromethanopterin reductase-like flavin-dependent oxidoreductase (luciferase family)
MKEEFEQLGADYTHRGEVTDEHIQVFKTLCSQEDPTFHGRHYSVEGIKFYPKPVQQPHPPIWVGGITPRAMRRAAILGDGWHVVRMRPHELAQGRDKVIALRRRAGLATEGYQVSIRGVLDVTDSPLGEGRVPLTGSPSQVMDDIRLYEEAGAEHIIFGPRGRTVDEAARVVERFASLVMPGL